MKSPRYNLTRSGRGWYKRVQKTPKWIVSAKKCPTAAEADAYFELHFGELLRKKPVVVSGTPVRDVANLYVALKEKSGLHPKTIKDYDDTMLKWLRVCGPQTTIERVTEADAEQFIVSLAALGAKRRQKHIVNMRNFVKWASGRYSLRLRREDFPAVQRRELRRDRAQRMRMPYTPNQVRRLMRYGSDRMRAVIMLGLNLALGPDEMANLTLADLKRPDFTRPRSKNGIARLTTIWKETRAACETACEGTDLALGMIDGKPIDPARLIRSFRRLCDRTGTPAHGIYNLRRTFRTIADDWGDQRAAAKVMGRELPDIDTVYVLNVKRERVERMLDHVKSSLQIGRALVAGRVEQWKPRLPDRVADRTGSRATSTTRIGKSGTRARSAVRG